MEGRHLTLSTLPIFPKHQSPAPIRQFFLSLPTLPSLTGDWCAPRSPDTEQFRPLTHQSRES